MDPIAIAVPVGVLIALLLFGMPIAFALLFAGFVGYSMLTGFKGSMSYLETHAYGSIARFLLSPIPLFVLMGEILAVSGTGAGIFDAATKWFGRLRGGLAIASIVACAVFASMTGLSMAGALTIGIVAVPEMIRRGYDKSLATGSVCCAGTLGILIPPSLPFIMYGLVAEQSVSRLFIAGIVPGLLLTALFSTYVLLRAWRQPHLAPGIPGVSWGERISSLKGLWPALVLIVAVLGSIYGGVATATEAASMGAAGALIISLAQRSMSFKRLVQITQRTVTLAGFVMFLVMGAMLFSQYLTISGLTQALSRWMVASQLSPWLIMAGIVMVIVFLGCFLDSTAIILITTPLFLPIVTSFQLSPVLYGVVLIMGIETAFITPPVGLNLYIIKNVAPDVPLSTILRGSMPFLVLIIVEIALLVAFPQIALWLPSTMWK